MPWFDAPASVRPPIGFEAYLERLGTEPPWERYDVHSPA